MVMSMTNNKPTTIEDVEKSMKSFEEKLHTNTKNKREINDGMEILTNIKFVIECIKNLGHGVEIDQNSELKTFNKILNSANIPTDSYKDVDYLQELASKIYQAEEKKPKKYRYNNQGVERLSYVWGICSDYEDELKQKLQPRLKKIEERKNFLENLDARKGFDDYDRKEIDKIFDNLKEGLKGPTILQKMKKTVKNLGTKIKEMRSRKTSDRQR